MSNAAKTLAQAIETHSIPRDNIGLVVDSAQAAFRRLTLPFTDRAKVEQVIKFEVESELPQWNIDDVIVDFHVLSQNEESCEVLVTAVPKEGMQQALQITEKVGIEPLEAELEATAMINAAMGADICLIDNAQVLVHVGERSTSVAVIDAGEVREMRVIHIGSEAQEATAPGGDDAEEGDVAGAAPADPVEVARRNEQAIKRIRRELGRTMSSARTIHEIEAIYVCGMDLPGLVGETILDTPVYDLDCFDADGGQPAEGYNQLVVAYGSALRQLGGGHLEPSLRREELRYSGTWERIEYPLAVASMLLFFVLVGIWFIQGEQQQKLNTNAGWWTRSLNKHLIGDVRPGHLYPASERTKFVEDFKKKYEGDLDLSTDILADLEKLKSDLLISVGDLQTLAGDGGDVMPQSAFHAASFVLGVLDSNQEEWRPSIRRITGSFTQARQTNKESFVKITMDIVFYDDDTLKATNDFEAFMAELQDQTKYPWVTEVVIKNSSELEAGNGISVIGIPVTINMDKYMESSL